MKSVNTQMLGAPVNKLAGITISSGESFERRNPALSYRRWTTPPAVVSPKRNEPNLSGRAFGKLTVIGRLPRTTGSKGAGAIYLVKCACGMYESRKKKAIENPLNNDDCCQDCRLIINRNNWYERERKQAILDEIAAKNNSQ